MTLDTSSMAAEADKPLRFSKRSKPLADGETFADLFAQTHLVVFRFIYGLRGGPRQVVEDLTADTYLRAWRGRLGFRGGQKAALSWLLRIARNLVIDSYRREKARPFVEEISWIDGPSLESSPEDQVLFQEDTRNLLIALAELSSEHREMVVLRYFLGWRVKEIAKHLGMAENTVSVNLRRILQRIRRDWPTS